MATNYYNAQIGVVDASGNVNVIYPITKADNVDVTSANYGGSSATTVLQTALDNLASAVTSGGTDDCMKKGVDYVTAGQLVGSTLGSKATAEGYNTVASGKYSHAEGYNTLASTTASHAEGSNTTASNYASHAEGSNTTASHYASHAEGNNTKASGQFAHAEGNQALASGLASHAEGSNTTASGSDGTHAEGYYTLASGYYSHAENAYTRATSDCSHAEGSETTASGDASHAEGSETNASGSSSHAEGSHTLASAEDSHAEGSHTLASTTAAHAEGYSTCATNYASHSCGHYNAAMTTGGANNNTTGTAFVIGNGTFSAKKNAFSVQYNGVVKAASTITASTTADYAEYFEWSDGNPDAEDRVGYFVTFENNKKIRIANINDSYILGIVSGEPFVLGNGDCDVWNGMVLRDKFGRTMYEPAPLMEIDPETGEEHQVYDEDGNPVYQGTRPIINPDYDPDKPYIDRADRPEWAPVGMLGVLHVRDDGTCKINEYATINKDGIATAASNDSIFKYRVISRTSDDVVEVVFR